MEYQIIKRKIQAVCVVLCLLFTVNSSILAELSYAQSTRLSLELSNVSISDVLASVEKRSEYVFFYSDIVLHRTKVFIGLPIIIIVWIDYQLDLCFLYLLRLYIL